MKQQLGKARFRVTEKEEPRQDVSGRDGTTRGMGTSQPSEIPGRPQGRVSVLTTVCCYNLSQHGLLAQSTVCRWPPAGPTRAGPSRRSSGTRAAGPWLLGGAECCGAELGLDAATSFLSALWRPVGPSSPQAGAGGGLGFIP